MEPLTKLAPDKRAIYDELSEAQQQRYWKVWQSKGPAYTHQMATLWAEGNQAARYEARGLKPPKEKKHPDRAMDYIESYFFEAERFTINQAISAIQAAGSAHKASTLRNKIFEFKAENKIRKVGYIPKGKKTREAIYEVVA